MAKPINIKKSLETVTFLEGRTRAAETPDTFVRLADYRDGAIFAGGFSGTSPWERHPADEIVQVLDGQATISLALPGGIETQDIGAGTIIVVPEGIWHCFEAPKRVTLMTVTPQPTQHTSADMPPVD